jgi:Spy/CpxP family protein refolding chaperone
MKLSRGAIVIYVGLVFLSGAVLGAFGHNLYVVSSVNAKATKNAEEFRKRVVTEYQGRLKLTQDQVAKLNEIMDETRASVDEARQKMKPTYQRIHEEQTAKIRAMLSPEQQAEYEKMIKEREERRKQSGHLSGPGF